MEKVEDYFFEFQTHDGSWRAGAWAKDHTAFSHISDPVEAIKEFAFVKSLLSQTPTRLCKRTASETVEVVG